MLTHCPQKRQIGVKNQKTSVTKNCAGWITFIKIVENVQIQICRLILPTISIIINCAVPDTVRQLCHDFPPKMINTFLS